ncbi:MAG TPA: methylenetetrahydrofolate reductase [Candidatus Binataceae bacterium]|nr:methylenetetrahydrofolate reductase [Candidatus Binataceae bacterium]
MPTLPEILQAARPALWVEVPPPRMNPEPLIRRLGELVGHADAINLTDNALGRVKMSGLAFASILKSRLGIAVVLNLSCRDRNRFALQSELIGAAALKIDAVVAMRGDPVPPGISPGATAVFDLDGIGLLKMIGALNRGDAGDGRPPVRTPPSIFAGTVANPNRKNFAREIELLERKAEAGARFVITQPVFDPEPARRFIEHSRRLGLAAVLGILPIKRAAMAAYISEKVSDLSGALPHLERYAGRSESEVRAFSIRENLELMKSLAPEVAGFNIMSGGGPSLAIQLAREFSAWRKHANQ